MSMTQRQKEILNFINDFLRRHGYSPTLEEIGTHFRMASLNGVYKHLKALEERGFIRRRSGQARSIEVIESEPRPSPVLPFLGFVAAGRPIEAVPDSEEVSVPEQFMTRGPGYVLRVRGDSMIEEHIRDGDLVVVEQRDRAENGEMVVALVDNETVTLKRYFREGRTIRLQPANPALEPLRVPEERVQIQGVVVGMMRRY